MYDLLVIGGGVMGGALALGMGGAPGGPGSIAILDHTLSKAAAIAERLPNAQAVTSVEPAEVYLLSVKPYHVRGVLQSLPERSHVISVAAGVRLEQLRAWAPPGSEVIRAMPNTACEIRAGVTALCGDPGAYLEQAHRLFDLVGDVFVVGESQFDVVSALSGSGPAYVFLLLEALQEAGLTLGLPAAMALDLARATVNGAGLLARQRQEDPRSMRLAVSSPGGMTAAAIAVFEQRGFRSEVLEAVRAAVDRAKLLGDATQS